MQRILYEVYRDRAAYEEHMQRPYVVRYEHERRPFVLATNVIEVGLQQAKVSPFPSINDILSESGVDLTGVTRSPRPGALPPGGSYPPDQPPTSWPPGQVPTWRQRAGCHLCDEARAVISRIAGELDVPWAERDVAASPQDLREYGEMIPVTLIDGVQHDFWRVDEGRLRQALLR